MTTNKVYRPDLAGSNIDEMVSQLKRKFVPLLLKIVTCPWHFETFTMFAHPVSRVSSQDLFLTADLLGSSGVSWATCLMLRHLSPPGMSFLCRKGSFLDSWPLAIVPYGNTPD